MNNRTMEGVLKGRSCTESTRIGSRSTKKTRPRHQTSTRATKDMALSMKTNAAVRLPSARAAIKARARQQPRLRTVVVRASEEEVKSTKDAAPKSTIASPVSEPTPTFGSLMSFSGPVPELANGRLAMLGFSSAILLEKITGEKVFKLVQDLPLTVAFLAITFIVATFIPLLKKETPDKKATGIFQANAEMWNGRAAMLGFALLLVIEANSKGPFF